LPQLNALTLAQERKQGVRPTIPFYMKRRKTTLVKYTLLTGLGVIFLTIFLPRTYRVPLLKKHSNIEYWQLPTGSKIAFTLVAAKTRKKPFPIMYLHGGPGGHVHEGLIKSLLPLAEDAIAHLLWHFSAFTAPDGKKDAADCIATLVYVNQNGNWLMDAGQNQAIVKEVQQYDPVNQMPKN